VKEDKSASALAAPQPNDAQIADYIVDKFSKETGKCKVILWGYRSELRNEILDALAQVRAEATGKLKEALVKYGRHLPGCGYSEWECSQPNCGETHKFPCTCGLERGVEK